MQRIAKVIRKDIKDGKGRPKSIKVVDTKGKTHKLKRKQYYGLFKSYFQFRLYKGRFPNYVSYIGKEKERIFINYQDT